MAQKHVTLPKKKAIVEAHLWLQEWGYNKDEYQMFAKKPYIALHKDGLQGKVHMLQLTLCIEYYRSLSPSNHFLQA